MAKMHYKGSLKINKIALIIKKKNKLGVKFSNIISSCFIRKMFIIKAR